MKAKGKVWREFFGYNKSERRGIFTLLILMNVMLAVNAFIPAMLRPWLHRMDEDKLIVLRQMLENTIDTTIVRKRNDTSSQLTDFNPNTVTFYELTRLGLSEKQSAMIISFRKKGGVFRFREDVRKIYSMTDTMYRRIEPFIILPSRGHGSPSHEKANFSDQYMIEMIELNSVDSAGLTALKGIGPSFASRIIRYRELLGGYAKIEQLKEVYGMDDQRYQMISAYVTADAGKLRKLNLRHDDFRTLLRHPYIDPDIARFITRVRVKDTTLTDQQILELLVSERDSVDQRLLPYIR